MVRVSNELRVESETTTPTPARVFRDAMGRFATGVTIVTAHDGDQVYGITVNGFLSVSLSPQLVLVSVRNESRMSGTIAEVGRYGVSVLASRQQDLSDHFAGRQRPGVQPTFAELSGVPLIEGALVQIAATVRDAHLAGDHTLLVGEVTALEVQEGVPLIFHGGGYRQLVEQCEWTTSWRDPELQWY